MEVLSEKLRTILGAEYFSRFYSYQLQIKELAERKDLRFLKILDKYCDYPLFFQLMKRRSNNLKLSIVTNIVAVLFILMIIYPQCSSAIPIR